MLNPKVVQVMKNLQASYDLDANKIVEQSTQERRAKESLKFLAMVAEGTKSTENKPQTFKKAWNHPYLES